MINYNFITGQKQSGQNIEKTRFLAGGGGGGGILPHIALLFINYVRLSSRIEKMKTDQEFF